MKSVVLMIIVAMCCLPSCADLDQQSQDQRIREEIQRDARERESRAVETPKALLLDGFGGGARPNTGCIYAGDCVAFDPMDDADRDRLCRTGCQGPAICAVRYRYDAPSWCKDYDIGAGLYNCMSSGVCPTECFTGSCVRSSGEP